MKLEINCGVKTIIGSFYFLGALASFRFFSLQ